jgi:predicted RNA-binding protein associated with RNAse of E/G family
MSLHPPRRISSVEGLGLNTSKQLDFKDESKAIGTEVWGKLKEPWTESGTTIAEEGYTWVTQWEVGKSYVITKFFDQKGELVGVYCDISRPVERIEGGFAFDDLYLDVWMAPDQEPVILDEVELKEAVAARYLTQTEADQAVQVALALVDDLKTEAGILEFS